MGTKAQLAEIIGDEEAENIVSQAETKSKQLVEDGVAFKDADGSEEIEEEEVEEIPSDETEEPEVPPVEEEEEEEEETPEVPPVPEAEDEEEEEEEEEESKTVEEFVLPEETVKALVDAFVEATAPKFDALTASVEEVGERVTELEKPIAEKVKEQLDLQPKVVVRRTTRSKEGDEPLVPVTDLSKGVDYENETPEQRAARLDAYWASRKVTAENEADLGE